MISRLWQKYGFPASWRQMLARLALAWLLLNWFYIAVLPGEGRELIYSPPGMENLLYLTGEPWLVSSSA